MAKVRVYSSRKSYITLLTVVVVVVVLVVNLVLEVVDCSIVIEKFKTVTKITWKFGVNCGPYI